MNGQSWTKISARKNKAITQHAVAVIDTAKFCTLSSSTRIPSKTNKEKEKQDNERTDSSSEDSGNLTVVISVPTAIIAVAIIVLVVVQRNRKKLKGRKTTRLDENPYYGQDEDYYEENATRVQDTNQYYEV